MLCIGCLTKLSKNYNNDYRWLMSNHFCKLIIIQATSDKQATRDMDQKHHS